MVLTQAEFEADPWDAVVVYILYPGTNYEMRYDFGLEYNEETGYFFTFWDVDGVAQPTIQNILDSPVTPALVTDCWNTIWNS